MSLVGKSGIGRRTNLATAALTCMLGLAIAGPTFSGGGFDGASRSLFIVLAGLSLAVAGAIDGRAASAAVRDPFVACLALLGGLSVMSAAWTIASPTAAVRWGLVIAGYAAIVISARTLASCAGPLPAAVIVVCFAVIEAAVGLGAVATHSLPFAERLVQTWRPGGTYEYQPALALLEVAALGPLTSALNAKKSVLVGGAAAALVMAGAVLAWSRRRTPAARALPSLRLRPGSYRVLRRDPHLQPAAVRVGAVQAAALSQRSEV